MSRIRRTHVVASAIGVVGLAFALSWTPHAARRVIARDTLASTFASDMRHVVYEWDPDDPRPEAVRRQALFDFVYETYDASAWIPQSLFDDNVVAQVVAGDVETIISDKIGLARWRDNALVPAFGMAPNTPASHPD